MVVGEVLEEKEAVGEEERVVGAVEDQEDAMGEEGAAVEVVEEGVAEVVGAGEEAVVEEVVAIYLEGIPGAVL